MNRFPPDLLRQMADHIGDGAENGGILYLALNEAAENAERLAKAEALLRRCPRSTTAMYVGKDRISYGDQVKAFLKENT